MGDPKDVAGLVGRLRETKRDLGGVMNLLAHRKSTETDELVRANTDQAISTIMRAQAALEIADATIERLEGEREGLHLAICGGEDAPGYAASLSHETVLRVAADNHASWRRDAELAWDGETASSWKARAQALAQELATLKEGMGSSRDLAPQPEPLTVPDAAVNADDPTCERDDCWHAAKCQGFCHRRAKGFVS